LLGRRRARISRALTKVDFVAICFWKSPRNKSKCKSNDSRFVLEVTRLALDPSLSEQISNRGTYAPEGRPMADPRQYSIFAIWILIRYWIIARFGLWESTSRQPTNSSSGKSTQHSQEISPIKQLVICERWIVLFGSSRRRTKFEMVYRKNEPRPLWKHPNANKRSRFTRQDVRRGRRR
jgi:hypothetical protein